MNTLWRDAKLLVEALQAGPLPHDRDVVVCPPYPWLAGVKAMLDKGTIRLGAQDVYWEASGAHTGAVSAPMLKDVGCHYCIIGHSERRARFGDTDDTVNLKLKALLEYGVTPIVCCGESHAEYEAGRTGDVCTAQMAGALHGLTATQVDKLVVAYEPIWAIGTGLADTPKNANQTMAAIRSELARLVGSETAHRVRILYGGSVNATNIDGFMAQPNIDGALVGGASLKAETFLRIIQFVATSSVSA